MNSQTTSNLIVGICFLLAVVFGAGYYFGQKHGQSKATADSSSTSQTQPAQPTAALPAVTPVETLRNFIGNFFFDSNFITSGYQQSPSLTQNMISTATANQNRQVNVYQTFLCTASLPDTISFNPQPLDNNATTATVTSTETLKTKKDVSPSYSFVLENGRWKIDQVTCPS